jgi:transcriptional regulator with XRE-family HTH domain
MRRLNRGPDARSRFVESHLDKSIAYQIRSLRGDKWTQAEFAEKLGMKHPNNVAARLENPHYGKHTLTTLKKIANACDVGLVVWFVPYGRLVDWVSGTPYRDEGLTPRFYNVPSFAGEFGNRTDNNAGLDLGYIEGAPPRKNVQRADYDEDDETGELGDERHGARGGAAERSGHERGLAAQGGS